MEGVAKVADRVSIALMHYPVYDRNRRVVASAVTNLDLHDIARTARTFGLHRYYVVTPVTEQRELVHDLSRHWLEGSGAHYNPKRRQALEILRVIPELADVVRELTEEFSRPPRLVATGAAERDGALGTAELGKNMASGDDPWLLLFGTGWGLADEVFGWVNHLLAPIHGPGQYNHLPVRAAAAIYLDRLFGDRCKPN